MSATFPGSAAVAAAAAPAASRSARGASSGWRLARLGLRSKFAVAFVLFAALPVVANLLSGAAQGADVAARLQPAELVAAFFLVLAGGIVGAHVLVRPIEAITAAMRRLAAGERDILLPESGRRDQRGDMAEAFNGMCAAIGEGESRLRDFAQTASVWFWETDETLQPTAWSETLRADQRVFLHAGEAPPPGAGSVTAAQWRQHRAALAARRPFSDFHYSAADGEGRRRHFRVSGMPIYDGEGRFRGYRGIGADETASMEARARAEHAEAVLLESIENISEGFALYDERGDLVLCNSKYRDLAAGQSAGGTMRSPDAASGQLERKLGDGRWVLMREWRTKGGGTIGIVTEISELKEREVEARVAKEHAELANRAKSEFLANMSHELRTPLNAIIGFSELMKTEVFGPLGDARYKSYAADICDSGVHLLQIINDILDLSKIEAARFELHDEALYIPDTVRSSIRIINQRAADAGVEVVTEIDRDLPPLLADQRCLKQILLNLLSNSVKFTLAGGTISVRAGIDERGDMRISVADSGIGIAEKDLPKALASFSQVDSALARKFQGTGLGLPLTKKLVELHGGTLSVESKVNVGTTVTAIFPKERVLSLPPNFDAGDARGAMPEEAAVA